MPDPNLDALLADADTLYRGLYAGFDALLSEANKLFNSVSSRIAATRDPIARNFNIFKLTRRADYEVTTHQPLIANLLDPKGTHGQGNLFLRPFLKLVTERTKIDLPCPDGHWEVDHNRDRIDVRLRYPEPRQSVIIETKWNAPELEGQVIGYWREECQRAKSKHVPVVFLTKKGDDPKLGAMAVDHKQFLDDLVKLAFRSEFLGLLRDSLREVAAERVRQTLCQYIDLLDELVTGSEEGDHE